MISQLITLLAVLLGAGASYTASALNDRARHRRDQEQRRSERRLDAYLSYLDEVKKMRSVARRMLGDSGLDPHLPTALPEDQGLQLLAAAEARRSTAAERVLLLCPKDVADSLQLLNQAVWQLELFARGQVADAGPESWIAARRKYREAIAAFHQSVRRDLGVPGTA